MVKRYLVGLVAAVVVAVAPAGVSTAADKPAVPVAHAAHSCSSGYTHAVTPGGHKCLRAGQYCSTKPGYGQVYRSKGFVCRGGRLRYR